MTNLQALQSVIGGNYPFDANMYTKALIDASAIPGCLNLDPADDYSATNIKTVDLAIAGLIFTVILSPDIAEGGYKVSQSDKNALTTLRNQLLSKYGLTPVTGSISNASNVW